MELRQRRLWDYREFSLLDKEVKIRMESPLEDIELSLKYEDLGFEIAFVRKKTLGLILTIILFIAVITGTLIFLHSGRQLSSIDWWAVITIGTLAIISAILISYADRKPQIVIKGGKESFTVLANSPDTEKVNEFITQLHENMIRRIIDIEVRPNDPKMELSVQKEALQNLLDNEIIDQDKFEEMNKQLKEKQRTKPAIGF